MPAKNWDHHVAHAEEIARGEGFRELRDQIVARAALSPGDRVLDLGAGTGLLTLAIAEGVDRVWALDISESMCHYLGAKVTSAGYDNVEIVVGSAVSLPLVDESVDVVVSNYCLHHLNHADKMRALAEVRRVLTPEGRLVMGDMMFGVGVTDPRDRRVILEKIRAMLRKGPAGLFRLLKNALRLVTNRWEQPARSTWWQDALTEVGFIEVVVDPFSHEGGIASGRKPAETGQAKLDAVA